MADSLSDEELDEFAKLYRPDATTLNRLREAGIDVTRLPLFAAGQSARSWWLSVNLLLEDGSIEDGCAILLAMVREDYPASEAFASSSLAGSRNQRHSADWAGTLSRWRIVFLGASPRHATPGDLRPALLQTDPEYRAIMDAGGRIEPHYIPFATFDDVFTARSQYRPHVLHVACHGDGPMLTFHDRVDGGPHVVHAAELAQELIRSDLGGRHRLHGIVLNACRSEEAAQILRPCADVVVAHRDDLPDDAAVAVARALYQHLGETETRSLAEAAEAVRSRATASPVLDQARRGLVVLTEPG
jgi:hypothetical protein